MKVVKKTKEYSVYQKGSGRFAVKDADKKWVNGDAKVAILLAEGLVKAFQAPAAPAVEEAPAAEVAVEETPVAEAVVEEAPVEDAAPTEVVAEEAPAEEPAAEVAEEAAEEAPKPKAKPKAKAAPAAE